MAMRISSGRAGRTALSVFLAAALVLAAACSSSTSSSSAKKDPGLGVRTLDCVVVEREEATGSGGTSRSYAGTGEYYMTFEAKEGEATSRYRLPVTRTQWFRFPEGSHVRITLNNNILTDIRASGSSD